MKSTDCAGEDTSRIYCDVLSVKRAGSLIGIKFVWIAYLYPPPQPVHFLSRLESVEVEFPRKEKVTCTIDPQVAVHKLIYSNCNLNTVISLFNPLY